MLSMRWNRFPVCSACDEISSPYAQCRIKFVLRMLSIDYTCKNVHLLPLAEHARKFVPRMLSMQWNWFRVCSACDKIVSAFAQQMHAIIFENKNFWISLKKICFRVCSVTAEMFEHQNSGENGRKRSKIFFENLRRAYKDLIKVKKIFKIISCLCTFNKLITLIIIFDVSSL